MLGHVLNVGQRNVLRTLRRLHEIGNLIEVQIAIDVVSHGVETFT